MRLFACLTAGFFVGAQALGLNLRHEMQEVQIEERAVVEIYVSQETPKRWSVYMGGVDYRAKFRNKNARHLEALIGGSYDLYQSDNLRAGLYGEFAGHLQDGAPLRFAGGGLASRYLFGRSDSSGGWRPFVGASLGTYRIEYEDGAGGAVSRFGGKLGLGVEAANGFFVGIDQYVLGRRQGLNFDRLGFTLGFRF